MNRLTILLLEDNAGDILLIRKALETHHIQHELNVVRDGGEALDLFGSMGKIAGVLCPDLVLLDLNLPKVDGPEILAEFRKHPLCAHTPVIVITSSERPKDLERMARLGVSCYFRKPKDLQEYLRLGEVILEVIAGRAPDWAPKP